MDDKRDESLDSEDEFHLAGLIEVLQRRYRLLLVVSLTVLVVSVLLFFITPKQYRSVTTLQIERNDVGAIAVDDLFRLDGANQQYYQTQYLLLQSRGLAERVVQDLNLVHDPVFNPPQGMLLGWVLDDPEEASDAVVLGELADHLLEDLEVNPVRDTYLVRVAYYARTPELAARVANGVAEAFIDWGIDRRFSTVGKASTFLSAQIDALKQEISDTEAQLQAYSRSADIVALDPQSNVILQRLEALNRDYTAAVSERIAKEAHYRELRTASDDAIAETLSPGLIAQLRAEQARLKREYANQLTIYKPEWPTMQELKAQIDEGGQNLEAMVEETVDQAREAARTEYQTALRREQSLAAELARQKDSAMELNSAAVEYNNLKVEVSTRRALLDELLRRQSETEVATRLQGTRDSQVLVVDRALEPRKTYRPSLKLNLVIGLTLGLMLGIGSVFFAEYLDRTIKVSEEVERVLGLPVLGIIPDVSQGPAQGYSSYGMSRGSKKESGAPRHPEKGKAEQGIHIELLPRTQPRLAASEAYRSLRTALLLSSADGLKTVVVTSGQSGEGKSVTAANLALVMAQLGKSVLLVDADLRKPRQHEIFKVSNRAGLVSFLTSGAEVQSVLVPTEIPDLMLVPAGLVPPNPAELLSSNRMRKFMTDIREGEFDVVIFDSPPVIPVTDPTLLGVSADGVVLCLRAGITVREDAVLCRDRLRRAGVKILGAVLNAYRVGGRFGKGYRPYEEYGRGTESDKGEATDSAA